MKFVVSSDSRQASTMVSLRRRNVLTSSKYRTLKAGSQFGALVHELLSSKSQQRKTNERRARTMSLLQISFRFRECGNGKLVKLSFQFFG